MQTKLYPESYFNTTNLTGKDLAEEVSKAANQEEVVMAVFWKRPEEELTPVEVLQLSGLSDMTPLTSIRRAITSLTDGGHLIKTNNSKIGAYGKKNYCWKLNKQ